MENTIYPDQNKQTLVVYFSIKVANQMSLGLTFNISEVASSFTPKHLGLLLDKRLSFNDHIQSKTNKGWKMLVVIKKLSSDLPRDASLRIHKSFVTSIMDYGDTIHDKPCNKPYKIKLEVVMQI